MGFTAGLPQTWGFSERSQIDSKRMGVGSSGSHAGKVVRDAATGSGPFTGNVATLDQLTKPKILVLDIETSPNLAYVWEMYNVDSISSSQLVEPRDMLCFAAKWLDEDRIIFASTYHNGYSAMIRILHELLDQADIVMTYNGNKFDIPVVNTCLIMEGFKPPSPYKSLDLYPVIRSTFRLPLNKLEHVLKHFGLTKKQDAGGFETWKKCLANDPAAWEQMKTYNIQDIESLQELYFFVRPWIPRHPSFAGYTQSHVCPNCGSNNLERRGYSFTQVSKYQRWQCKNCGKWSRSTHRESGAEISEAVS